MGAMITTHDNPVDPRVDYLAWSVWDTSRGYNSAAYLSRVANVPDEMPEPVRERFIEDAIDEIVELHNGKIYKKLKVDD